MQHRNFSSAEKSRKFDFAKIRVCNACNESCCAARIETRSKRATSVEIEFALQLVACAASDAAHEFFKCPKNQENSILRKIRVCNACNESCCAARIETRSKRATSVEIEFALQLVACAASDAAHEFFKCPKNQENSILRKIRVCNACNESCCAARIETRSKRATSVEIEFALQLVACAASDAAHEFFKCPKNQENSILRKIRVCNACNESCCAARIETRSKRATSVEIEFALQLVACAASDAAQEFFKCPKNQENSILRKIRVCNACNESCCAARIETRSKRATSVEIEFALQLVACAASDAAQEFFKCTKNQENSILRKIRVCSACNESCCAARIETRSKRATSVEIELALQLVACAASDAAQDFFKCP